jgi:hypothetical protein
MVPVALITEPVELPDVLPGTRMLVGDPVDDA